MFPLLPGLIAGGASLLGSIFSSDTSAQNTQAQLAAQQGMQKESEEFNAGQAQMNRDFQQQMSSTAYQRSSADMKAAGLNPMMMFGSGGAASTPGGSAASIGTPSVPMPQNRSPLGDLGANVRNALDATINSKTLDKMTEEISNLQTQRALDTARTDTEKERARVEGEETRKRGAEATSAQLDVAQHKVGAVKASDILSMPDDIRQGIVQGESMQKQFGGIAGGLVGSAKGAYHHFVGGGASFSDRFNPVYGNTQ